MEARGAKLAALKHRKLVSYVCMYVCMLLAALKHPKLVSLHVLICPCMAVCVRVCPYMSLH